jgi:16S rRNA (guanine1207-N2)-methyltransferase
MAERILDVPQGQFELLRRPLRPQSQLRAWDAADAYLARHLADEPPSGSVAVLNDSFGALAAVLTPHAPHVVADTAMARAGIAENLDRNGLAALPVVADIDDLPSDLATVVVRVPKTLGLLEDQLQQLRPHLAPGARVIGGGMVRDIHTSTLELFETILGPTVTSLAERRARLIHPTLDSDLVVPANPWPRRWTHDGIELVNRGGIFSATSIDIGTRFLLDHLPPAGGVVVDLGCGNGVLGVAVAQQTEASEVHFVDASTRAVDSARASWQANEPQAAANFHVAERLVEVVAPGSVDVIVNNPPFHEERAIGDGTAWDMFVDAHQVLRAGGELRVVANRQLGHHSRIRKIFGNCRIVASNRKFVVLSARR